MKTSFKQLLPRTLAAVSLIAFAITGTSCMTTYDAYGRPMQTVDPGVAIAGAAAAGVLGYALANDNHYHHGGYYRGSYYRGGPRYYRY